MTQLSDELLNDIIAQDSASLKSLQMPEIPSVPDYRLMFGVQYKLSGGVFTDGAVLSAITNAMGATAMAIHEYRNARDCGLAYINQLPEHDQLPALGKAFAHMANCIMNAQVTALCLNSAQRVLNATEFKNLNRYERLRRLSNRIRHFDEDVDKAITAGKRAPPSPIWFTDAEVCSASARLTYQELADMLQDHAGVCKFFADDFLKDTTVVIAIS